MYWRIGPSYHKKPVSENRDALHQIVTQGPPPGLVAFEGDLAVGWCQLTPRSDLSWLEQERRLKRVDDLPVWSLSCFYVRIGYRRKGVTVVLIHAALEAAKRAGAVAVEAYPLDSEKTSSTSFTGYVSTFERAGFRLVTPPTAARPILRHDLKKIVSQG